MAGGYACDFCGGTRQAAYLLTDMRNGNTIGLCEDDLAPGLIPLLASELGVEFTGLYTAVEKHLRSEARKAEKELATARATEAQPGQGQAAGPPRTIADAAAASASGGSLVPPGSTCSYCGRPLDDGQSHLHGGRLSPGDAEAVQ